ncbi:hypothetical protein [Pantoea sp. 18069]|uniref:hypothetical protein n=1 Tax=Pantoea sp. 18069 TaxID=2681415 RepID=UPI00135AF07B|nr:hypothetical protein [Pantoea sp. 18069]
MSDPVTTSAAHPRPAQTLGAARGTPALRVLKHYRDAARALVIVTSTLYPENRYSIVTTLARSA